MSSPYLDCPECKGVMFANTICGHCQINAYSEHEMLCAVARARREAIEEAAKVCETLHYVDQRMHEQQLINDVIEQIVDDWKKKALDFDNKWRNAMPLQGHDAMLNDLAALLEKAYREGHRTGFYADTKLDDDQ